MLIVLREISLHSKNIVQNKNPNVFTSLFFYNGCHFLKSQGEVEVEEQSDSVEVQDCHSDQKESHFQIQYRYPFFELQFSVFCMLSFCNSTCTRYNRLRQLQVLKLQQLFPPTENINILMPLNLRKYSVRASHLDIRRNPAVVTFSSKKFNVSALQIFYESEHGFFRHHFFQTVHWKRPLYGDRVTDDVNPMNRLKKMLSKKWCLKKKSCSLS